MYGQKLSNCQITFVDTGSHGVGYIAMYKEKLRVVSIRLRQISRYLDEQKKVVNVVVRV